MYLTSIKFLTSIASDNGCYVKTPMAASNLKPLAATRCRIYSRGELGKRKSTYARRITVVILQTLQRCIAYLIKNCSRASAGVQHGNIRSRIGIA